ncbi:MAG: [protein-PII] uridylyltransferase [Planctomycetaceae bacterium]
MSATDVLEIDVSSLTERRRLVADFRDRAAQRSGSGDSGIEICEWYSDRLDELLTAMVRHQLVRQGVSEDAPFAVVCVGGNGRRRPAPYSDLDLLLVAESRSLARLSPMLSGFVRDCWDTGFQLGHSIRSPDDVVRFALEDVQFATSLIEMRLLTGSASLFDAVCQKVQRRVFGGDNPELFVARCVAARREEWMARGDSVNQVEPDVKRSPGGLRDLHLLRWVTFVRHGDSHPATMLEHGELRTRELAALTGADEFLTTLRVRLHCQAKLKQDVLTRELQLQLANGKISGDRDSLRGVEIFMQEYFRQTSQVSEITRRVTEVPQSPSILKRFYKAILPSRTPDGYKIENDVLDLDAAAVAGLRNDPVALLDAFLYAATEELSLAPWLRKSIGKIAPHLPRNLSREATQRFRRILRTADGLPQTLRMMNETGILQWLIPEFAEIGCLIQFNQYHSYTVDEHTLKTIHEVVALARDESPVGSAYEGVRHKATLHLSLLMHDIGKGREGDHSIIGAEICEGVATRLQMAEHKKQMMKFLVRHHLVMPDLAFRRDITDPSLLTDFARLVGSPEQLRMLYVLSVADIRAVGPDVWTDWKGELLAELYGRTMEIVSGRPFQHMEQERLHTIREHVRQSIVPIPGHSGPEWSAWIDKQLNALPPFYLMTENPDRIARDLDIMQQLGNAEVRIEGQHDAETDTVRYRILASSAFEPGSFHKMAGILSGLRMDICTAQSCTMADGTLIACFQVIDNDFSGPVPDARINSVSQAMIDVLTGKISVDSIFRKSSVFRMKRQAKSFLKVPPQVSIDNDCSEKFTVVDVFAMDSPGLLYTLALTLHQHGMSVELTRIATRIDQIVDVFYIVDASGRKVTDSGVLESLRSALMTELQALHDA